MTITEKAYKKYKRDGFFDLFRSTQRFLAQKVTQPAIPIIYDNTSHIRYSDIIDSHSSQKTLRLDSNIPDRNSSVEIPFSMDQNSPNFRDLPRYSFNDQYVSEFENVRLVGPDAVPITADGSIIVEAIEPELEEGYRLKQALHRLLYYRSTIESYISGSEQEFDCVCSLVTSWDNYYHWTIEHLPKLRAVEAASNAWDVDPTLLIPEDPPSYIIESLELMGYNVEDCIQWNGGIIHAKKYIQPTFTEPTKEICNWLRDRAVSNIKKEKCLDKRRIYISRRNTNRRNIKNEENVEPVLHEFGFDTHMAENLSFEEQVQLFQKAELIIGVHGAGLTNIVWSKNTTIIEIFNKIIKPPYYQIANNLNLKYNSISGKPINEDKSINSNILVDVEEIEKILNAQV